MKDHATTNLHGYMIIIIIGDSHSSSWPKFFSFAAAAAAATTTEFIHSQNKRQPTLFVHKK